MTDNDPTTGIDLNKQPHKSIIKRIDIGLTTGMCALLLSFIGILTSRATFKMNQQTQKSRVLPIIEVDLGYYAEGGGDRFEISLTNSGAGIAYIRNVTALVKGEPATEYLTLQDAVMNRRMRGRANKTWSPGAGYLRSGETIKPWVFKWSSNSEIDAYKRGAYGEPMDGVDVKVCYCSVFDDCWTSNFIDKRKPISVSTCGAGDTQIDFFQNYIDQEIEMGKKYQQGKE